MTEKEFIEKVSKEFNIDENNFSQYSERKLRVVVEEERVVSLLTYLKNIGFSQLSLITAVDWIDDNKFELVYNLTSWTERLTVLVKTYIDREKAEIISIMNIWPAAKYYEWDVNEYFGIKFLGNPQNGQELFLEDWDDIPPMRKDFDPVKYSDKKFPRREYDFKMVNKSEVIE